MRHSKIMNVFGGFVIDVKNGTFGKAKLQASDFSNASDFSLGPFKPNIAKKWYSIDLASEKNFVNQLASAGGLTQLRLRLQFDDNNNDITEVIKLFSGNAPRASRPKLIVYYTLP